MLDPYHSYTPITTHVMGFLLAILFNTDTNPLCIVVINTQK